MPECDAVFAASVDVAYAVQQERPTFPPDDDHDGGVPVEAAASDWPEQRETMLIDSELKASEHSPVVSDYRVVL